MKSKRITIKLDTETSIEIQCTHFTNDVIKVADTHGAYLVDTLLWDANRKEYTLYQFLKIGGVWVWAYKRAGTEHSPASPAWILLGDVNKIPKHPSQKELDDEIQVAKALAELERLGLDPVEIALI